MSAPGLNVKEISKEQGPHKGGQGMGCVWRSQGIWGGEASSVRAEGGPR
jgi:hypothetical protein